LLLLSAERLAIRCSGWGWEPRSALNAAVGSTCPACPSIRLAVGAAVCIAGCCVCVCVCCWSSRDEGEREGDGDECDSDMGREDRSSNVSAKTGEWLAPRRGKSEPRGSDWNSGAGWGGVAADPRAVVAIRMFVAVCVSVRTCVVCVL
jgi:hypothetical protein